MSKSFFYRAKKVMDYFLFEPIQIFTSINDFKFKFNSACFFLGFHCYYAFSTKEIKKLYISKKYNFVRNGFTEFMVIDKDGNHYNINNSLWYWKWNSVEDWNKIEPNNEIIVKYYGWRIPILGLFPNIVQLDNDNKSSVDVVNKKIKNNIQNIENYYL